MRVRIPPSVPRKEILMFGFDSVKKQRKLIDKSGITSMLINYDDNGNCSVEIKYIDNTCKHFDNIDEPFDEIGITTLII